MQGLVEQEEMPEDVLDAMEQVGHEQSALILDKRLLDLLSEVTSGEERERIDTLGLSGLSGEERAAIAIRLMRHYNKVTHIFELVKAYGSTSQVEYNRAGRAWQRRENIAAKHEYEVAVNPLTGEKLTGVGHAPLVYADDPRADIPAALQRRLAEAIDCADDRIVAGWLRYESSEPVSTPEPEAG